MKLQNMGSATGYIIGTVVLVPLILYIISVIFYSPNNVKDLQITQYINNTVMLKDNIGKLPSLEDILSPDRKIGRHTKSITFFLSRYGDGQQQYYGYVYYSKEYNKYFNLLVIAEGGGIITEVVQKIKDIILTVNRDDLNNPKYGTLDNPVPVLKFIGVNKSIRDNDLDYNKAYMDKMFHDNVEMYLKYIMPKKEFKERFKK